MSSLNFCVESLQSVVSVLSQVESEGEVGANPTASAASASGINPVSRDGCFFPPLTIMYRVYAGREKSLKKPLIQFPPKPA